MTPLDKILLGAAAAVGAALVGAVVRLFQRVRALEGKREAADVRLGSLESNTGASAGSLSGLRNDVQDLKVCMAREFVHREDWVPAISRITGALERQGEMLARLEERQKL